MKKLFIYPSVIFAALVAHASYAVDSMLEQYNYDMIAQGVSKGFEPTASSVNINGSDIFVSYTTWADTAHSINDIDDRVVRQNGLDYSSTYGLAMVNKDSVNGLTDWHTIDNNQDDWKFDFDMVLFSFSEAVTLTNTKFKYLTGAGDENQLTVVGFDNIDIFTNTDSIVTTWTDIANSSAITSVTHKNISPNPEGLGHYEVTYPTTLKEAKYWLVGAYNTYFDPSHVETDIHGSGFKLASLGVSRASSTPPNNVSEPGVMALMLLSLGLLCYRRKRYF